MNDETWTFVYKKSKRNNSKNVKSLKKEHYFGSLKEIEIVSGNELANIINSINLMIVSLKETLLVHNLILAVSKVFDSITINEEIEIICLGIGSITTAISSQLQLALILCLHNHFRSKIASISIFDPLMNGSDHLICKHFEIHLLQTNMKGNITGNDKNHTIFYAPHCPKQLYNNVLWCNWSHLNTISIIGNRFVLNIILILFNLFY